MKKVLLIALATMLLVAPARTFAQTDSEPLENTLSDITLTVNGTNVRISNANGEIMEIFNLTGVKVASVPIDSPEKTFKLTLPKGCYILKVGKIVRKISIR